MWEQRRQAADAWKLFFDDVIASVITPYHSSSLAAAAAVPS